MAQRAYRTSIQNITESSEVSFKSDAGYQAFEILHVGFAVAPLIAGTDKFFNSLCDWDQYLAPQIPKLTGIPTRTFMMIVGGIEIAAGLGVAVKPKYFGYVVSGWLAGIVVNLLMAEDFYDVALRDFGLCLGALALGRLSSRYESKLISKKAA